MTSPAPDTQHATEVLEQVEGIFFCSVCGKSQPGTKLAGEVEVLDYSRYGIRVRHIGNACTACNAKLLGSHDTTG